MHRGLAATALCQSDWSVDAAPKLSTVLVLRKSGPGGLLGVRRRRGHTEKRGRDAGVAQDAKEDVAEGALGVARVEAGGGDGQAPALPEAAAPELTAKALLAAMSGPKMPERASGAPAP
mmetsp:Transcript_107853/g.348125  ORF Transcript_107853/g.348125 Transcript_107853/m.348125 type:complete len:119 (+) Transcript_107853:1-357(+)